VAFQAHSATQYLIGIHWYICKAQPIREAAKKANMNPTVLWRAATGWTGHDKGGGKRDGDAGRAVFLDWLKKARESTEGAPCCGARIVAGTRPVPKLGHAEENLAARRDLETQLRKAQADLDRLRAKLGAGDVQRHEGDDPPADELDEARE
jgi:hypothetical protein